MTKINKQLLEVAFYDFGYDKTYTYIANANIKVDDVVMVKAGQGNCVSNYKVCRVIKTYAYTNDNLRRLLPRGIKPKTIMGRLTIESLKKGDDQ